MKMARIEQLRLHVRAELLGLALQEVRGCESVLRLRGASKVLLIESKWQLKETLRKVEDESLPDVFYFTAVWCGPYLGGKKKPHSPAAAMAEVEVDVVGQPRKRTFKKFSYRGTDIDTLLYMSTDDLVKLFPARARRRVHRGLKRKPMALIKKLSKAKREAPAGEKPAHIRTHLRNMIIVPGMIGSVLEVYNGKTFNPVEIKPEMIGHYLAEFSFSNKPVKHGRPGISATHSSRFIPRK